MKTYLLTFLNNGIFHLSQVKPQVKLPRPSFIYTSNCYEVENHGILEAENVDKQLKLYKNIGRYFYQMHKSLKHECVCVCVCVCVYVYISVFQQVIGEGRGKIVNIECTSTHKK